MKNVPNNDEFDNGMAVCIMCAIGCGVTICSSFASAVTVAILWWLGIL